MAENIEQTRKQARKTITLFAGLFMFVGSLTMVFTLYEYAQAVLSNNWPSVSGIILESSIVSDKRHLSSNMSTTGFTEYRPNIRYQYEIEGKKYVNDKIAFKGIGGTDINIARRYVGMFPVNKKVKVMYSPLNKSNSVLIKGIQATNIWAILGGGLFFLFGYLIYKARDVFVNSIPDSE